MASDAQVDSSAGTGDGENPLRPDQVIELTFAPEWARKPPADSFYADHSGEDRPARGRSSGDRRGRGPRDGARRRDRGQPDRTGKRTSGGRDSERRPAEDSSRGGRPRHDRSRQDRTRPERDRAQRPERIPPAEVEVRFLPERERLRRVVRQLTTGKRAYPLMGIAWQFLARPEACEVQIRPTKKTNGITLHQCPVCRAAATRHEWVLSHAVQDHLVDLFDKEDILIDAPAGNFVCVARCGLSRTLLGPPNHHSYKVRMEEIRAARYPHMSPAEYEQRVETIRDAEVIEQWKEESRKKTVYRRKGQSEDEGISHAEAVAQVKQEVLDAGIRETRSVAMPARIAQRLSDRGLLAAVRQAWEKERRFPSTLLLALRGALGNMRLHIFRVKKRHEYASPIPPKRLDTEQVVPAIAEMLEFMADQPGCTRHQIRESLRPDLADDQVQENLEFFKPLLWLIERGHVIEFFDGSLAVPIGRRAAPTKSK